MTILVATPSTLHPIRDRDGNRCPLRPIAASATVHLATIRPCGCVR